MLLKTILSLTFANAEAETSSRSFVVANTKHLTKDIKLDNEQEPVSEVEKVDDTSIASTTEEHLEKPITLEIKEEDLDNKEDNLEIKEEDNLETGICAFAELGARLMNIILKGDLEEFSKEEWEFFTDYQKGKHHVFSKIFETLKGKGEITGKQFEELFSNDEYLMDAYTGLEKIYKRASFFVGKTGLTDEQSEQLLNALNFEFNGVSKKIAELTIEDIKKITSKSYQ